MENQKINLLCALVGTTAIAGFQEAKGQKPNVIIIYADDIGYGDLECNGAKTIKTPNVNRLAQKGIRFENSHSTSAVSTPSRYGLLTGEYPWRKEGTGIAAGNAGMIIRPEQYTMADMFKETGYATGAVGKWHLGLGETAKQDWNGIVTPGLKDIGFDYSYIMAATGDRVPCVYIENGQVENLDPTDPIEVSYEKPFEGEPTGLKNPELLKMTPSHGHDQAVINGISRIGYMKGGKSALWRDEDIADKITDKALGFITDNQKKPFFLYFGTNDIHVPRAPHERFVGKSGMGARGDALLSFDACVGRVMNHLEKLGLLENTLVILSSDNGPVVDDGYNDQAWELLGAHKPWGDFRGGKYSIFEAGTRVPMIVRWGNKLKGNTSKALFSHIDLFSSLATIAGATLPQNVAPDSEAHVDVLLGKSEKGRKYIIEQNVTKTLSLLTNDGWKYIEPSKGPAMEVNTKTELGNNKQVQLYQLSTDKNEQKNVAKQHPDRTSKLATILESERKK